MSTRHRLILLATSACGAAVLMCPFHVTTPAASLGSIVSAAPPLFGGGDTAGDNNPLIDALRREAGLALGQLQARDR